MRENILPATTVSNFVKQDASAFGRRRSAWTLAAIVFSVGGFLLGLTGMLLSALAYLEAAEHRNVNSRLGGLLMLFALPLFFLAAHALDRIAFYKQAGKLENRRSSGRFFADYE